MFKSYDKIKRLGSEETAGILEGICYIQEKVDGANAQIWMEDGEIKCGSRRKELESGFNGFVEYAKNDPGIRAFLECSPYLTLYGEWLVPHTIKYNETSYGKFYMFDIYDRSSGIFYSQEGVKEMAEAWGIKTAHLFGIYENPSLELIKELAKQSTLGDKSEGVVIKNYAFVNKFGDTMYAKYVNPEFKEENAITFGGNNRGADHYHEIWATNKYMTMPRIKKIMQKLSAIKDGPLDITDTARVIQSAYHDMFEEAMWEIAKKCREINFVALQNIATRKASKIFRDILEDHISVAYNQE